MLRSNVVKGSAANSIWNEVEDWVSGLNQQFTKLSAAKVAREFESLIFREYKKALWGHFLFAEDE